MGRLQPVYYKWIQFFIIGIVICLFGIQSVQNAQFKSYLPECKNNQSANNCQKDAFNNLKGQRTFGMVTLTIGLIVVTVSGNQLYKYYRKVRQPVSETRTP